MARRGRPARKAGRDAGFATGSALSICNDMAVIQVPHQHAHASAVAGEFAHELRWLCFTWDSVGPGDAGARRGGETLLGRPGGWSLIATFRPFAPPGGDAAAGQPWRSAAALAWELGLDWTPADLDTGLVRAAWETRVNCPATSSVGRLFEAASALLGLVLHACQESEGSMAVEALADTASADGMEDAVSLPLTKRADGVWQADWAPMVPMLLNPAWSPERRAAAFHASLATALVTQVIAAGLIHGDFAVGLTGGVFQNRRLSELVLDRLKAAGFRAYLLASVPCSDAGLSFGQVVEALARQ